MSNKLLVFVLFVFLSSSTAYSGTLVVNFNDGGLDKWRMYENFWLNKLIILDSGNWIVENGEAIAGDENAGRLYGLCIGDMSWKDYTAEVRVKLTKKFEECPMDSTVQLNVRCQMDKGKFGLNNYTVALGMWHIGVVRGGFRYANGDHFDIQTFHTKTEANVWYKLRMTVEGDHIIGFVDDVKAYELIDGSFISGAVTIAVNGVKAVFDDFMVTGPEIPDNQLGRPVKASGKLITTWANIKASN